MLVLALVLAMTVLFCSCEQKPIDPPETTPAETTEEPLPETFDVVKDGKITLTRIVRSADITSSDAPEITAAKKLRDTINNALEAQQMLAGEKVDLIFVDINMPDLNGVDFVRALIDRPMVIFTTAYSEYAVEGFKLDAVDYLLKPFSFADFSRSAAKANSLYELRHNQRPPQEGESEALPKDKEYISVKADYKVSLVKISDIVYLESEGEYVRMHLADGTTITTLFRLKNMETALPSESFMRVHRSYIVNLRTIKAYVKGRIFLNDTEYVPIGENYKEAFQGYIDKNFRNL